MQEDEWLPVKRDSEKAFLEGRYQNDLSWPPGVIEQKRMDSHHIRGKRLYQHWSTRTLETTRWE